MTEERVLSQLLYEIPVLELSGSTDVLISSLEFDSRKIAPGALFVATSGTASDGHSYIDSAIQSGAVAVVCEQMPELRLEGVCYVKVDNSAKALGHLAAAWFDFPSSNLCLVGVTGTNGKTTIATLLYQLFRQMGHKVGLLSTVVNYIDDEAVEATHTTPDALSIDRKSVV